MCSSKPDKDDSGKDTLRQALREALDRQEATNEILQVISSSPNDTQPVFEAIVRSGSRLFPGCAISMAMPFGDMLDAVAVADEDPARAEAWRKRFPFPLSREYMHGVAFLDAKEINIADVASSPIANSAGAKNFLQSGYRAVTMMPMLLDGKAIGVISVVRPSTGSLPDHQVAILRTFATQAVIAIENVRRFKELEARTEEVQALNADLEGRVEAQVGEIERMGRLKRFLSPQVADAVVSAGDEKMLSSHRALISVLFCDIRGFTAFCETAEPEETIDVLQTYHEEMGALIAEYRAGVDHRSGDGIMVIFNDPLPCEDPAGTAVRLALAMQERMQDLCTGWRKLGHRLGFGVGISIGYATVGMVGSEGRYEYTASGTVVNLGARLCDLAEDGEILLSLRAATALEEDVGTEAVGEVELKGMREPVEVFRLIRPSA